MQTTLSPSLPCRPATRASTLLQPLAPFLALLLAGHASGQDVAAATKPKAQAPVTMTVCETGNNCWQWRFDGKEGNGGGVGSHGEAHRLSVRRYGETGIVIRRTDVDGPTAGLTATYTGTVQTGRVTGTFQSLWPGHPAASGKWSGSVEEGGDKLLAIAPPQDGTDGKMVGKWGPLTISFDDGKTIHGSDYRAPGYNHVYVGRYVDAEHIEFTVTRIDPQGCKTSTSGRWHLLSVATAETQQDGWNGCGVKTGPATGLLAKAGTAADAAANAQRAGTPEQIARARQMNEMMMALLLGALTGGADSEENCAERTPGTGRCVSQSEAYEKDSQRRDSAARAQRSANP